LSSRVFKTSHLGRHWPIKEHKFRKFIGAPIVGHGLMWDDLKVVEEDNQDLFIKEEGKE